MKYKKILVATDLSSHSQATLNHVRHIFKEDSEVTLVTVIGDPMIPLGVEFNYPTDMFDDLRKESIKRATETLEKLGSRFTKSCRKEVITSSESPARVITGFAKENGYDLIVIGSHGAGRLSSLFLGTTAQMIIKLATCPVLVIPEKMVDSAASHSEAYTFSKLLIGTDLSAASLKILQVLSKDALEGREDLTLVSVLTPFDYPVLPQGYDVPPVTLADYLEQRVPQTQKHLSELGRLYFKEKEVSYKVLESNDNAAQVLCDYAASNKSNVIVVGSHGQGIVANLFIGSTVQNILKLATCPVLVFPVRM